ncbi:hypothetical protein B0A50_02385 [Salinomyces thailandicus]|uniref:Uncharacterized protein n=1 Tax=Salinomyces thailandicus TaxID=706561 RepID=A0A4U0U8U5_9PEZI|nr:hypothetical protein B0A50_02385 [Salinomyces thailandica]
MPPETKDDSGDYTPEAFISTFVSFRTHIARSFFWFVLPLNGFVVITAITGHLESWTSASEVLSGHRLAVSWFFVMFGVWLGLSAIFGIPAAGLWELWWNPFVHQPSRRGRVSAEVEHQMMMRNRAQVRWLLRDHYQL